MSLFQSFNIGQVGGGGYGVGVAIYIDSQVGNTTTGYVDTYSYGPGGHLDTDVRAWRWSLTASAGTMSGGAASGSRAPNFSSSFDLGTSVGFTVTHDANGNATISGSGSWDGTSAGGWFTTGFAGSGGPWALPSLQAAPNAPTAVTATRASDSSITLAWTRNVVAGKPYNSQTVYVSIDGASPIIANSVLGTATSYAYAASANHKYVFTVVAANGAGSTSSAASNTILTTPNPLASLNAAFVTSGTIRLTLPVRPTPYTEGTVVVEETHDAGVTWNSKTSISLSSLSTSGTTTWDDTSAQTGGTVQYRATVQTTGGTQGTLSSAVTLSNVLILNTPPGAPTNLTPSGPVDASQTLRLAWSHTVSADGAAQSSRKIRYSTDSGSTWTQIVAGNTTQGYYDWTITLTDFVAGATILWQVATAGSEPGTYGAWSASQTLTLYGSLAITLTADNPPDTHTGGPMPVAWSSSPTWGSATQVQYRVSMAGPSGQTVYDSGFVTSTSTTASIPASVQVNDTVYTVTVILVDSNGITSQPANRTVTTDYLAPGPISLAWFYDDSTGSLTMTPSFSDPSDSDFDDTYEWVLERSLDGDAWSQIGSAIGETPLTDILVRLGADSWYRATAVTSLGVAGEPVVQRVFAANVTSMWGWLNYGEQYQSRVRFGWGETKDRSAGRASDVFDIERDDDGDNFPLAVFGTSVSEKMSISGTLLYKAASDDRLADEWASSTEAELLNLAKRAGVCVFRSAKGDWWETRVTDVKTSPKTSYAGQADQSAVSFSVERITV